jgi:hypothetical protein
MQWFLISQAPAFAYYLGRKNFLANSVQNDEQLGLNQVR